MVYALEPEKHLEAYHVDRHIESSRKMVTSPYDLVVIGSGPGGQKATKVTVVDKRDTMLGFCDDEIVEALQLHLRDQSVTFRFDEEVTTVDIHQHGTVTKLASGKLIPADTVMYSAGRQGCTDRLGLENTRLQADNRGRIPVDDNYRTNVEHIYAVGDVIGLPALAATSGEQGRLAAYHAFGEPAEQLNPFQPTGVYTIPEVSFVGATEAYKVAALGVMNKLRILDEYSHSVPGSAVPANPAARCRDLRHRPRHVR